MRSSTSPEAALSFDDIDVNNDGSVNRDEMRAKFQRDFGARAAATSSAQIVTSFDDIDANADGVLTREEFEAAAKKLSIEQHKRAKMLAEEQQPSPRHVFMYAGAFVLAIFLLVPVWCSIELMNDEVYLHFASKGFPLVLEVVILLALLWVVAPRCFGLYMGWPSCPCLPVVPGCCLPGCPSCPAVPGCPIPGRIPSMSEFCADLCPELCAMPCMAMFLACCCAPFRCLCCCCFPMELACEDFWTHPLQSIKIFLKHFFMSVDVLLCVLTATVLIYVWYNMGLVDFFLAITNIHLAGLDWLGDILPDLSFPGISFRAPTLHDVIFFFPWLFKSFFYWVASPTTTILFSCCTLFILYLLMLSVFFKYTKQTHRAGKNNAYIWSNLMVIWSSFVLAIGLILMLSAMPVIFDSRKANIELFQNCETGDKTRDLYVASQALHTLRLKPGCAALESVEDCEGFESSPASHLLKYMEQTFHCSGFCWNPRELPGGPNGAALPYENTDTFTDPPPTTLFSHENYLASCDGMAARDMTNFTAGSGQRIYHVGMLLILISMGSLFLKLRGFFAPDDTEGVGKDGDFAYGATLT